MWEKQEEEKEGMKKRGEMQVRRRRGNEKRRINED